MKSQKPTIVLTGGGSGGHITPLLSVAHELKKQSPACQIVYIGHKGDRFDNLKTSSAVFDFTAFITGGKFRRYHGESFISHLLDIKTLLLNTRDLFRVIGSIAASARILKKVNPDVIFSKGSFVAVPVGVAAHFKGIPIVTHDSDTVPGLANRIIGRWATFNTTGMPEQFYAYPASRLRYVGVPPNLSNLVQTDSSNNKTRLGLPRQGRVLLVAGGGHGSKTINDLVLQIGGKLLAEHQDLTIVHIAGANNEEQVRSMYKSLLGSRFSTRIKVFGYTPQLVDLIKIADLIIGRAGASSLSEYALFSKPAIIIPSPFLAGGHQLKNAQYLASEDAITLLPNDAEAIELLAVVNQLFADKDRRKQLGQNLHIALARPNAAKDIASLILEAASGR